MAQLTTGTFSLARAMRGLENPADAAPAATPPSQDTSASDVSLDVSAHPQPSEATAPATVKPEVSAAARILSEQHADLHAVHAKERNSVIFKAAASIAVFVPSAAYCAMSFTAVHIVSAGEILGTVAGGVGAALSAFYFSSTAGPAISRYLSNRKDRHPEYAESAKFNEAKDEHLAALYYTDRADAVDKYAAAMAQSTPVLQVKCAYGIMDLAQRFVDPSDRAAAVAKICENSGKELDGTRILKHAAHEISECAASWIEHGLPSKRVENARWVENACVRGFPTVTSESEQVAQKLVLASNRLHASPAARHVLLRAAFALADPTQVTKGNIEELLIGNAELFGAKLKFEVLKDVSGLKGVSTDGFVAIAGQLEQLVPALGADDAIVANRMVRDLTPTSYQLSKRAKGRVAPLSE